MTEFEISSDITVKLIRHMAADDFVVQAAQVSAKGENNPETVPARLIEALLKGRHGSPFEHGLFTFFVEAPIVVFREWHRHRMSSINEMSGRYTVLPGKFYVPADDRKLINRGTKMKPEFYAGSRSEVREVRRLFTETSHMGWHNYNKMLKAGISNEVSRMVLPLNTYSQMYWSVNPRSIMNFLSLRVESDDSLVRSYPQWEIQMGADKIERHFAEAMPATHAAFVKNGRVAP